MTSNCFDILNDFVGFGNPRSTYWFIGLEEADGCWGKDPEKDQINIKKYENRITPVRHGEIKGNNERMIKEGKRFTTIYYYMSYLVLAASGKESDSVACRKYMYSELFQVPPGDTFQANLYPMGKRSLNEWNDDYEKFSRLKSKDAYYTSCKSRFTMLGKEWSQYPRPRITVCFGKYGWGDFKKIFPDEKESSWENKDWYEINRSGIILCPFFGMGKMKSGYKEKLAEEIQTLLKNR